MRTLRSAAAVGKMTGSNNRTNVDDSLRRIKIAFGTFFIFLAIITVAGNILVIGAISSNKRLMQGVTNWFLSSLACADLLIGAVIMPLYASLLITGYWSAGSTMCAVWTSIDVLSTTASIETLCAIAIDRYVAITSPLRYQSIMTRRRAYIIIICVWLISATISVVPIHLGWWRSDDPAAQTCYDDPTCCDFITNKYFAVISSAISFYIPHIIMIFVYNRVLKEAERQFVHGINLFCLIYVWPKKSIEAKEKLMCFSLFQVVMFLHQDKHIGVNKQNRQDQTKNRTMSISEKRALKTLSLVMGVFIMCWLPFFIANILQVLCDSCIPNLVFSFLGCLGYLNSTFNPFLYARNPEFMAAYKNVLFCKTGPSIHS
uniref:beta-1 adrenergic receptor-like n=1 Tax=Myxine glutinosa TaxID=7769 RepID=UPI0035902E12